MGWVCQISKQRYSKSRLWPWNLNLSPKTVNNLFKFHAQERDLEHIFLEIWQMHHTFWIKATFNEAFASELFLTNQIVLTKKCVKNTRSDYKEKNPKRKFEIRFWIKRTYCHSKMVNFRGFDFSYNRAFKTKIWQITL